MCTYAHCCEAELAEEVHGWVRRRDGEMYNAVGLSEALSLLSREQHEHKASTLAPDHFSLLTSRDIKACEESHQPAYVHVTCLRSNGLAHSTADMSLSLVLHHCDGVCWPMLWTGRLLVTRCCYFKASVSLGMTAKPAEDLSAAGNKCPPEGCPAQAPSCKSLAL